MLGIMIIALVVFGPQRLPEIAKQIGKAIREVRKVSGQFQEEIRTGLALDDDTFPYMKGPQTGPQDAQTQKLPPQIAVEPEPLPPLPPEPGIVRYGEVRPPGDVQPQ
jgi:TatA/E family protein of Tat protein translocase